MIFWFGNDKFDNNVLVKYFAVEGYNSIIFLNDKALDEKGKLKQGVQKKSWSPVLFHSIVFIKQISAVFSDCIIIYDKYPKLTLKQIIPVVTREDILSGKKLPLRVAVLEQDPQLIRSLYERKHKITWFVLRLPKVMPYIFYYNFEHLILNPFGAFQINHDGSFIEVPSLRELVDGDVLHPVGRNKIFFRIRHLNKMFFYGNRLIYEDTKKKIADGFSTRKKNYVFTSPVRKGTMAWYNILSIYRGLYDFSQQIYGRTTNTRNSSRTKFRDSTYKGGGNKRPCTDSQEISPSN